MTRIGESLLVTMGVNIDASKGNFGIHLIVEPRLLARRRPIGAQVPLEDVFYLIRLARSHFRKVLTT